MKLYTSIFVVLVLITYAFTTEVMIATNYLIQYLVGLLFIKLVIRPLNHKVKLFFSLFYSIYGLLTLVTQFELIPIIDTNHYYVHNDAADAFYPTIIDNAIFYKWSELIQNTLLNPMYALYPLSCLIFAIIGKIAILLDVENLRLFLRMHEFLLASLIVALITDIPYKFGSVTNKTHKYIFCFSLCSYLYITSAIFTRDTHVCFAYALLGYIYLLPKCRFRLIWFIALLAISTGFRPVNGVLASLFVFTYYASNKKNSGLFWICMIVGILFSYTLLKDLLSFGIESLSTYEEMTASNTGGLFMYVYSLPFPINQIFISIYMLCLPLPITSYIVGDHGSLMNLPFCLSPYLMTIIFGTVLYIVIKGLVTDKKIKYYIYLTILLYIAIISASPDIRRGFAAIPSLFMVFLCCLPIIPHKVIYNIRKSTWMPLFIITIALSIYVFTK